MKLGMYLAKIISILGTIFQLTFDLLPVLFICPLCSHVILLREKERERDDGIHFLKELSPGGDRDQELGNCISVFNAIIALWSRKMGGLGKGW